MAFRRLASVLLVGIVLVWGCSGATGPAPTGPSNGLGPDGGSMTVRGLELKVPAGALTKSEDITIERIPADSLTAPDGFQLVGGTAYRLGPEGLTFQKPVTVTISYDPADLPPDAKASRLRMLHFGSQLETPASTVDQAAGTVEAQIDHFSAVVVGAPSGPYQTVACPDLSPAASHGQPLDRVALGQLPSDFQPPLAALAEVDGDTVTSFGRVDVNDQGNVELIVPVHPSTSPQGGPVQLSITDGTFACASFDFQIDPLDPAPGELKAIADELQGILDAQEAVLGTSREELLATPAADLPQVLIPIALAQGALNDPDNDSSLVAIADGTSPVSEAARLDLLEPLLARTGLRSSLAASVSASGAGAPAARMSLGPGAGLCTPDAINNGPAGPDTGLLDACMQEAADAAFQVNGATGKLYGDMSQVLGAVGLVPGLGTPAGVAGFVVWLLQTSNSRTAALLPSSFVQTSGEVGRPTFKEDEPGPDRLDLFNATASNVGYDLGKELLNGLLQSSGVASTLDGFMDAEQVAGADVNSALSYVLTGPVADGILKNAGVDALDLKPELFGPVLVMPQKWSTAKIVGDAFTLRDSIHYDPEKVGTATLVVRTNSDRFGGQQATWQSELTVKRLQVTMSPTEVFLAPGTQQEFQVEVTDAFYPEQIRTDTAGLQGTAGQPVSTSENVFTVTYTAPTNPDPSKPDLLTVRDTANTGARTNATEPRVATATIHFGQIRISPSTACLDPGDTLQFSADVKGLTDPTVTWSASAGSIDPQTGLYVAPASAPAGGTAIITAQSVQNSEIKDQVTVNIGGCDCGWSVQLEGSPLISSDSSDTGQFVVNGGGYLGSITLNDTQSGQTLGISAVPPVAGEPGIPIGTTGSLQGTVIGNLGLSAQDLNYTSVDYLPLVLSDNDGQTVAGTISGTVMISSVADPGNPRSASLTASFRIVSDGFPESTGGQTTYSCTVGSGG